MLCPKCNSPIEKGSVFCGTCGHQIAPLNAPGATVTTDATELAQHYPDPTRTASSYGSPYQSYPTAPPTQAYGPSTVGEDQNSLVPPPPPPPLEPAYPYTPPVQPPDPSPRRPDPRVIATIVILLVLLVGGVSASFLLLGSQKGGGDKAATSGEQKGAASTQEATKAPAAPAINGTAFFSDSSDGQGLSSDSKINVKGLSALPAGSQYNAWLIDVPTERITPLGTLTPKGQNFELDFAGQKINLIGTGNKIQITQEQGKVSVPTGNVLLSGTFPPNALIHVRHLLFQFATTPNNTGLLVGLREQARLLNAQALLLKSNATNEQAVRCVAQSIIDIAEGQKGTYYQALSSACLALNIAAAGDGFGLLGENGYIHTSAQHASLAATQADSTETIKLHAGHVRVATDNLKEWVTTIDQEARSLLENPGDTVKIQKVVTLAEQSMHGVDADHSESIDPVPGEAGATTAYIHGQLMAQFKLVR